MKKLILPAVAFHLLLATPAPAAIKQSVSPEKRVAESELVVTTAVWGSGNKVADVTKRVAELLASDAREFFARKSSLQVDPWPYRTKALAILYRYDGRNHLFVVQGGDKVTHQMLVENAKR